MRLLRTAITGLKTNKVRSFLTILGIVIGITAIIMIMSLGKGANSMIMDQISGWGSTSVALKPGAIPKGITDMAEIYADSIGLDELAAVQKKSNVPHVENITPMVMSWENVIYESERTRGQILGTTPNYIDFLNVYPSEGFIFDTEAVKNKAKVVVLGWKVKNEIFGESSAINESVKIKDQWFRVIGVFPKTGTVSMQDVDELILLPYTTAQEYLLGTDYFQVIILRAENEKYVNQVAEDIAITIRELHDITDPKKDDFHVGTMERASNIIGTVTGTLTLFLGAVAAISLIVGGIGIMNIMLVSVTERTREIGLRKALGATSENILSQFLLEAVILTGIGGILGILLGAGFSFLTTYAIRTFGELNWGYDFPVSGAILGVVVATGTGLVFGIYPAKEAAKKSPIESLRHE